jgi:hypothetical protein
MGRVAVAGVSDPGALTSPASLKGYRIIDEVGRHSVSGFA